MAAELDPAPARDAVSLARTDGALVVDLAHQRPVLSTPAPLSPARSQLRAAIASVTSASAALERAQQPIERLTRLIAEHDFRARKLADLRAVEEDRLTAWLIAGSAGPRPVPAQEIVELERELQTGSPDQIAAKKALESLQPDVFSATARVRSAGLQREHAAFAAALGASSRNASTRPIRPAIAACGARSNASTAKNLSWSAGRSRKEGGSISAPCCSAITTRTEGWSMPAVLEPASTTPSWGGYGGGWSRWRPTPCRSTSRRREAAASVRRWFSAGCTGYGPSSSPRSSF
jgi:hypothetical protein